VFFPSSSPGAQVVSTFATFAAAFLVRPLGGLVFPDGCGRCRRAGGAPGPSPGTSGTAPSIRYAAVATPR
ncbi:hypothetical protein DLE01_28860, partial [Streptomyces sp. FT05W]